MVGNTVKLVNATEKLVKFVLVVILIEKNQFKQRKLNMKILGIGNAIVDVICKVENDFLEKNNLTKSTMKLIFDDTDAIDDNFSNLKKIIAKGNVLFEREQETIKSDLVSFSPKENKITITGNVKVVKGKNVGFTSNLLEINLENEFLN